MALVTRCAAPSPLPDVATGRDLAEWAIEWIGNARCERVKREALLASWPL